MARPEPAVQGDLKSVLKSSTAQQAEPHKNPLWSTDQADLTGPAGRSKFGWLPRFDAGRCRGGVRPILENSTACQKSMPSLISVCFGGLRVAGVGRVFLWLNWN